MNETPLKLRTSVHPRTCSRGPWVLAQAEVLKWAEVTDRRLLEEDIPGTSDQSACDKVVGISASTSQHQGGARENQRCFRGLTRMANTPLRVGKDVGRLPLTCSLWERTALWQ